MDHGDQGGALGLFVGARRAAGSTGYAVIPAALDSRRDYREMLFRSADAMKAHISGVILFLGLAIMLYALGKSLGSEEGFGEVKACLTSPLAKLVTWALLSALLYHLVAGVRHLIMDMGIGETLEGGKLGSKIVIVISVVVIVLVGVWVW